MYSLWQTWHAPLKWSPLYMSVHRYWLIWQTILETRNNSPQWTRSLLIFWQITGIFKIIKLTWDTCCSNSNISNYKHSTKRTILDPGLRSEKNIPSLLANLKTTQLQQHTWKFNCDTCNAIIDSVNHKTWYLTSSKWMLCARKALARRLKVIYPNKYSALFKRKCDPSGFDVVITNGRKRWINSYHPCA